MIFLFLVLTMQYCKKTDAEDQSYLEASVNSTCSTVKNFDSVSLQGDSSTGTGLQISAIDPINGAELGLNMYGAVKANTSYDLSVVYPVGIILYYKSPLTGANYGSISGQVYIHDFIKFSDNMLETYIEFNNATVTNGATGEQFCVNNGTLKFKGKYK